MYRNVKTSKTGIFSHVLGKMGNHKKIMMHFLGISILLDYLGNIKYLIDGHLKHLTMFISTKHAYVMENVNLL